MYDCLILVDPESDISLKALADELQSFYAQGDFERPELRVTEGRLDVCFHDYAFRISRCAEPFVLEESGEIAENYAAAHANKDRIAKCRVRFELSGQDDPDMDFFNDYLFINEAAARLAPVYSFDPCSGEFL